MADEDNEDINPETMGAEDNDEEADVAALLDLSKNNDDKKMIVNFNLGHFEIVVIQNQKLLKRRKGI